MSVVINEMDVLVEPASAGNGTPPAEGQERPQEPQLTLAELRELERMLAMRRARLRAH